MITVLTAPLLTLAVPAPRVLTLLPLVTVVPAAVDAVVLVPSVTLVPAKVSWLTFVPFVTATPLLLTTVLPVVTLPALVRSRLLARPSLMSVPVRVTARLVLVELKSTLPPGATLAPVVSPLAATFHPLLAAVFTTLNCSSVAARPDAAKPGVVSVVLVRPVT